MNKCKGFILDPYSRSTCLHHRVWSQSHTLSPTTRLGRGTPSFSFLSFLSLSTRVLSDLPKYHTNNAPPNLSHVSSPPPCSAAAAVPRLSVGAARRLNPSPADIPASLLAPSRRCRRRFCRDAKAFLLSPPRPQPLASALQVQACSHPPIPETPLAFTICAPACRRAPGTHHLDPPP
jgi:hypothetical protein